MAKGKPRGLISKRVSVLDCNCSWDGSLQGEAERFDHCICKVRVTKGKRGATVSPKPDLEYIIPTVFIAAYPKKAWGPKVTKKEG